MASETRKLEMTPAETAAYERILREIAEPGAPSKARENRLAVLSNLLAVIKARNELSATGEE